MPADLPWFLFGGFVAALAAGLAGFAFALVASAFWYHLIPPTEAAPVVLVASLLMQVGTLLSLRGAVQWRAVKPFLVGGVLGVPLGTWALAHLDPKALGFAVGVLLICYGGYMLARIALRLAPPAVTRGGRGADGLVGFIGGVMGGVGGFSGALPSIWCDLRGWRKDVARGIYQPFILLMQTLGIIGAAMAGLFNSRSGELLLWLLPVLLAGGVLGVKMYNAATAERFRLLLLVLLLVSGISLVV